MKTTSKTTTNKRPTSVSTKPSNETKPVMKLTKAEQNFIDTFDGIFKGAESIRQSISKWLKDDKQHKHIEAVAEYYKATNESKMKSFKAQVQQVAKELEINLSLQGLGKKQVAKVAEPKKAKGGNTKVKDNTKAKPKQLKVDDYVKVAKVFNEDDYAEAVFKLAKGLTKAQKQALIDTLKA